MDEPHIEAALPDDLAALRELLHAGGLPGEDLRREALQHFLVARGAQSLLGSVGLEIYGDVALLRSLAVAPGARRQGLGQRLLTAAEALARRSGIRRLYLLTTTAEPFFAARGYAVAPRSAAPAAIAGTAQFNSLCPSSASFMSKAMPTTCYNILFLCTGNSARSILGEAIANHLAPNGRFVAYSAGSKPRGEVNPAALELLRRKGLPTQGLRSKSWDEFAAPGAPQLDFIITVCDQAAGEQCPYWPGQPMSAHWGMPDPAAVQGSPEEVRKAFEDTFVVLRRRIELLASLPLETLERMRLQQRMKDIGRE